MLPLWILAAPDGGGYLISPPVQAEQGAGEDGTEVDLRQLEDARGLALLVEDDGAAQAIESVIELQRQKFAPLLAEDEELAGLEQKLQDNFAAMFQGRSRTVAEMLLEVEKYPAARREGIVAGWLRKLFWRAGVVLERDLERLDGERLQEICAGYQARSLPARMEPWRLRLLLWLLRDRESLRLFARRDERVAELSHSRLEWSGLDARRREAISRYLELLQGLRLEAGHRPAGEGGRTLRALLRGLRYMDTIRQACEATGLDHRLMTRIFIQESAFVHQRVSHAGAYSLAQFLDIALKDIWLFRARIPGAQALLRGVSGEEDLRRRVIEDPRWAIRAACVYFRRLRDEVVFRLGEGGAETSQEMLALLSLELYLLRGDLEERARLESQVEVAGIFSEERADVPLLAGPATLLPDAGLLLGEWLGQTLRRLAEKRLSAELFRQRLEELYQALGLAAYNSGMQNLLRASAGSGRLGPLAFPLQIGETRSYVSEILAGRDLLARLGEEVSPLKHMGAEELERLGERACRLAGSQK